ncbi:MAG TPA: DUF2167 domain-containing protein [Arenimonas sp.]|uniref:DUF2167 domain-containing protein n=1 Tax=Arenimonas sp. TaxID=1872635 RepID=UPI002BE14012|nr:DUF2167 domain-containing protein [Arenimonas sp.]HMB55888.1 DUF2167 domain-containing protein [Arenimonas sp.]
MKQVMTAAVLACGLWVGAACAQDGQDAADAAKTQALLASLHFQTGDIALEKAGAHLHVQPGFRYLGHDDTRRVLEDLWGNPPDDDVLGLLVPDAAPLNSEHGWAVVVTFSDDGFVSDEDAAKINYADLLKEMQTSTHDDNADRKKEGYPTMELAGWAQPPSYDAVGKRLYWAKDFSVEGETAHTLNYDIRVLGREGYLSLNALSSIDDLGVVKQGMTQVLPMAEFDSGHRYADYKAGSDKLAAYGLAALIGGGVAAKAGLFGKLGLLLLGLKKFIIIGIAAIGAAIKKLFGGKGKGGGTVQ